MTWNASHVYFKLKTDRQFGRSLVQEYADAYTYPFYVKLGV